MTLFLGTTIELPDIPQSNSEIVLSGRIYRDEPYLLRNLEKVIIRGEAGMPYEFYGDGPGLLEVRACKHISIRNIRTLGSINAIVIRDDCEDIEFVDFMGRSHTDRMFLIAGSEKDDILYPTNIRLTQGYINDVGMDTSGTAIGISRNAEDVLINEITVDRCVDGVVISNARKKHRIINSKFINAWREDGIDIKEVHGDGEILIDGNLISGNKNHGINLHLGASSIRVRNNTITANGDCGIAMHDGPIHDIRVDPDNVIEGNRNHNLYISDQLTGAVSVRI